MNFDSTTETEDFRIFGIDTSRKIAAIRFLRAIVKAAGRNAGLREAKDAIDSLVSDGTEIVVMDLPSDVHSLARLAAHDAGVITSRQESPPRFI